MPMAPFTPPSGSNSSFDLADLPPELAADLASDTVVVDDVDLSGDGEGPIFICGLDDVLDQLERSGGARLGGDSGSTLEELSFLLTDAGFSR